MQQKRIPALHLCHLDIVLFTKLKLLMVGYALCTVVEKPCQHGLLDIRLVAHSQRRAGEHNPQGMLIAVLVHFMLDFLLVCFHIIMFHIRHLRLTAYCLQA